MLREEGAGKANQGSGGCKVCIVLVLKGNRTRGTLGRDVVEPAVTRGICW